MRMNTCALHETFEWIAIEPSRYPHLVSASGHKLKHHFEQSAPMKLRDGRKIWSTFQVREINGPIMSVGKFCTKGNHRCATFTDARWCLVARRSWRSYWWAEKETTTNWNVGSHQETCWRLCSWAAPVEARVHLRDFWRQHHNEQTLKSLRDVHSQGAHQELTKNTLNLRSFMWRRYWDPENPA